MKHIILLSLMFVSGIFAMAQTDNSLKTVQIFALKARFGNVY